MRPKSHDRGDREAPGRGPKDVLPAVPSLYINKDDGGLKVESVSIPPPEIDTGYEWYRGIKEDVYFLCQLLVKSDRWDV
jgi:hypothetical protein